MTDHLLLEQDGAVAVVTFNRPEARNAMTFEMSEALHDACERLDRDPGVRAVVLRGAGDRSFASGTDIRQFLTFKTREDALGYEARISRVLSRIAGMTKPTIAMVQGDAVGGGMFMALACDRSEEHTSELQSPCNLVCRLLLEKKKTHSTPRLP